jgi:hypothetical protein
MMFRRIRLAVATTTTAVSCLVLAAPAAAAAPALGYLTVNGTASLPTFPCAPPPPFGNGPCAGSFAGSWTGHVAGVQGTSAYDVTWGAGSVGASFQYSELQCLGLETALGIAAGSGSASSGPGQVQGKWQVPGETFARDVYGVRLSFTFQWTRVGTSAVLVLSPFTLTLDVTGLSPQLVVASKQYGAATFAPTSHQSGPTTPTCANPWTGVAGQIAGSVTIAPPSV